MKVSWGGVFAGVLVALGIAMLMSALSAALGAPAQPGERGAGVVLWSELQRFVALFLGGMVATRTSAIVDKATLVCEGVLVWVVSLVVMAHIGGDGAASTARGAFAVLAGTSASSAETLPPGVVAPESSPGEVVPPEGPAGNAARLRGAELAERVAAVTGLSVADTRAMLTQAAERLEAQRPAPAEVEDTARPRTQALDRALAAQEAVSDGTRPRSYAWLPLASLLVSLVAAVAGALVGRGRGGGVVTALP